MRSLDVEPQSPDADDSLQREIALRLNELEHLNLGLYAWEDPVAELREMIHALAPGATREHFEDELERQVAEVKHKAFLYEIDMTVARLRDDVLPTGMSHDQLIQEVQGDIDSLGEGDEGMWLAEVRRDLRTARRDYKRPARLLQHGARHRRASGAKPIRRRGSRRASSSSSRGDPDDAGDPEPPGLAPKLRRQHQGARP